MNEFIIKVNGMVCEGCENRVQNAVKTISGVDNVVADHKNGTVTISTNDESIINEIKEKITDIGFEVVE